MDRPSTARTCAVFAALAILAIVPALAADAEKSAGPRRLIHDRSPTDDGIIKILLYHDMEGVSGQNILTSIDFPRPEYFEARELLTSDANAVIDGLIAGGAESIDVVDAHGSFNPEPDLLLDKLDPRARMLFKKERYHPYVDLLEEDAYDAIVAVAMHSKTGGGGFAEHTINLGTDWILNGMSLNESEILAYSWGRVGVPLILVSGDDKLAEQLEWMGWLEMVTVKEATGIDDALLYPVDEIRADLREAARRSVEKLKSANYVTLTEPVTATLRVIPPADLSVLERVPGIEYDNQSVTFRAADFQAAYDGMRGLLDVAQTGYYNVAAGLYLSSGEDAFMAFKDAIFESWTAKNVEPDKTDEQLDQAPSNMEVLYFGSK